MILIPHPQQEIVDTGATILSGVNINNIQEVLLVVQGEIDGGKTGSELNTAIIDIFGTPAQALPQR